MCPVICITTKHAWDEEERLSESFRPYTKDDATLEEEDAADDVQDMWYDILSAIPGLYSERMEGHFDYDLQQKDELAKALNACGIKHNKDFEDYLEE